MKIRFFPFVTFLIIELEAFNRKLLRERILHQVFTYEEALLVSTVPRW